MFASAVPSCGWFAAIASDDDDDAEIRRWDQLQ
jgi:hypothetical protein